MIPLERPNNANLSRFVYSHLVKSSSSQVWMRVPMTTGKGLPRPPPGLEGCVKGEDDTWHWWNSLRGTANTEKKLHVALVVSKEPPEPHVLDRQAVFLDAFFSVVFRTLLHASTMSQTIPVIHSYSQIFPVAEGMSF